MFALSPSTTGSAPANDRARGFDSAVEGTAIEKIDSQTGDFTRDGGKTVMEGFLQKYGVDGIDLVYAHNDDMALGAIEAIEAAGAEPGVDIQIVSIDAVKAVPNGRGLGVFYWEPTWTAVSGNGWDPTNPSSGNGWENQALFDYNDRVLPALSVLGTA